MKIRSGVSAACRRRAGLGRGVFLLRALRALRGLAFVADLGNLGFVGNLGSVGFAGNLWNLGNLWTRLAGRRWASASCLLRARFGRLWCTEMPLRVARKAAAGA